AQARPLAARRADIHELIVVPELEYARRVRGGGHQGGEHEPLRAADRHNQAACARRLTTTLRRYCSCNASLSERRKATRSSRSRASRNSSNGVRPLTSVSWKAASALPTSPSNCSSSAGTEAPNAR